MALTACRTATQSLRRLTRAGSDKLRRGDVALVRTGRMTRWPDHDSFMADPPGVGIDAARMLAEELEVMCVGADCGGEPLPAKLAGTFLPVHSYLLADMGVPVIENMWLEELASEGVQHFTFLGFPLKLLGSTGLPLRPVALPAEAPLDHA